MQVNLDADHWADLREIDELRADVRRAVNKVSSLIVDVETKAPVIPGDLEDRRMDELIKSVVTNWSLQLPLPSVDPKSLLKLTLKQDEALRSALEGHLNAILGREAPVKDNEGPTESSAS